MCFYSTFRRSRSSTRTAPPALPDSAAENSTTGDPTATIGHAQPHFCCEIGGRDRANECRVFADLKG